MYLMKTKVMKADKKRAGGCFWGHKWSKWKQFKAFKGSMCTQQRRICLRCNKIQEEYIKGRGEL